MSDQKCSECIHWTQTTRALRNGVRLCRHPDALLNTTDHKRDGTELVMHTGANFSCARHEGSEATIPMEPTGLSFSPDGYTERFEILGSRDDAEGIVTVTKVDDTEGGSDVQV